MVYGALGVHSLRQKAHLGRADDMGLSFFWYLGSGGIEHLYDAHRSNYGTADVKWHAVCGERTDATVHDGGRVKCLHCKAREVGVGA